MLLKLDQWADFVCCSGSLDSVRKFLDLYVPKPAKDTLDEPPEKFEPEMSIQDFNFDDYCDYNQDIYRRYNNWDRIHCKPNHVVYFEYVQKFRIRFR